MSPFEDRVQRIAMVLVSKMSLTKRVMLMASVKASSHVTFLARFSHRLKWVKCSPVEVFKRGVKRSKVSIINTGLKRYV